MKFLNRHHASALLFLMLLFIMSCQSLEKGVLNVGRAIGSDTIVKSVADLTPQQEYYLGRSVVARVLSEKQLLKSDNIQDYLNKIGQYLAVHSLRPVMFKGYRFIAVNDTSPTAMSAPGGFVIISSEMLRSFENEDELASVLAHEIAHIELRHAEESIKSSNRIAAGTQLISALSAVRPSFENLKVFTNAVADSVGARFNQSQEIDADKRAIGILMRAGYSPRALGHVLRRMPDTATFFGKHPRNRARIDSINESVSGKRSEVGLNQIAKRRFKGTLAELR